MKSKDFLCCLLLSLLCGCSRQGDVPTEVPPGQVNVDATWQPIGSTDARLTGAGDGGYWPWWRGPEGTGVSAETGWSAIWPASGPAIVWRTNIGTGFSSMSVADGRLYTMGNRDGQEEVKCLDAAMGEPIWSHSYSCSLVANMHEGGPGATPTVDGEWVFTFSKESHLHCLAAATGEVKWSKQLSDELGVGRPSWGFTCSPYVLGEMLILDAGHVVSLDKATGDVLWQTEKYPPGYGSPIAFRQGDKELIAVLNNAGLLVVQAQDGGHVAFTEWETNYETNSTTPIVAGDTIYVSTGYGKGCGLFRLAGDRLQPVYANRKMRNQFNNSVFWDGHVYGFDGNSDRGRAVQLVCMDYTTGKVAWSERGFGCGSLMIADGKLIILSDDGELAVAEASSEGLHELARAKVLDGRCWTVPVLAGGRIYCRNAVGDLVCLDVSGS